MESGLESQLELLKQLEESIDNCNNKLNELTKTEDISQKINNNLEPKSRAEIHWACAYGTYTSYYLYLLLNEIHPKDHQLNKEIKSCTEIDAIFKIKQQQILQELLGDK